MSEISFEGRVAVITGAGGGLGKIHLARRYDFPKGVDGLGHGHAQPALAQQVRELEDPLLHRSSPSGGGPS